MPKVVHLSAHALLQVRGPQSVEEEALPLLDLSLVFRLILGQLSDLSLTFGASQPFLERILLVLDGSLQRRNSLLPFLLLMIDHLHQIV